MYIHRPYSSAPKSMQPCNFTQANPPCQQPRSFNNDQMQHGCAAKKQPRDSCRKQRSPEISCSCTALVHYTASYYNSSSIEVLLGTPLSARRLQNICLEELPPSRGRFLELTIAERSACQEVASTCVNLYMIAAGVASAGPSKVRADCSSDCNVASAACLAIRKSSCRGQARQPLRNGIAA